jgi:hypothetical protein
MKTLLATLLAAMAFSAYAAPQPTGAFSDVPPSSEEKDKDKDKKDG